MKTKSDKVPEVGKTYNCFDDGKMSYSRLYTVDVVRVIPFDECSDEEKYEWEEKSSECNWLFASKTDYLVFTENGEAGDAIFARTIDGGWFSLGWFMNSGRLDIDGALTKWLEETYPKNKLEAL